MTHWGSAPVTKHHPISTPERPAQWIKRYQSSGRPGRRGPDFADLPSKRIKRYQCGSHSSAAVHVRGRRRLRAPCTPSRQRRSNLSRTHSTNLTVAGRRLARCPRQSKSTSTTQCHAYATTRGECTALDDAHVPHRQRAHPQRSEQLLLVLVRKMAHARAWRRGEARRHLVDA